MFQQDALPDAGTLAGKPMSSVRAGKGRGSNGHALGKKRSDFLRAYSPVSFSQALRVVMLVLICLGFSRISHVAQAWPGSTVVGKIGQEFMSDLRYRH